MLGAILRGGWKDDWSSRLKRTEARWPWRLEILQKVKEVYPDFPQKTFDRRWDMVQIALETLHDADPAPYGVREMAVMIAGDDVGLARRIATRYFVGYQFFSWLEDT